MSKERAKGTAWETKLLTPLRMLWPKMARTGSAAYGDADFTDPQEVCPYAIEAKHHERIRLPDFMDQAVESGRRTGRTPVLIVQRKYRTWHDAYAVQRLEDWVDGEMARQDLVADIRTALREIDKGERRDAEDTLLTALGEQ